MTYEEFKKLVEHEERSKRDGRAGEAFTDGLLDYNHIRPRIFYRLIAVKGNEEILERSPHILFFDMAITFRWLFHEDEDGISSALIEKKHLEYWNVNERDIIEEAIRNTPELFPIKWCRILEMINQWVDLGGPDLPLYVMTNRIGINGASVIFYRDVWERFRGISGQGIYILPSSIHEVLLIGEQEVLDLDDLYEMVWQANHTVVSSEEFLSNQVLYYDPVNQEIEIAHSRK
ncbi:MAG: DUF5688 family protein [Lachnospiraceae bacterium]|nr:DUF5688 family protein [Lachnospiraceae bacterium]